MWPTLVFANWVAETPLSTPRDQFTGGVINGKIYVFGGNGDPNGINLKSTEPVSKRSILFEVKKGENFNHGNIRNILNISRIKIRA